MAGPGDKVAEAIMMLMQQGRQRGMPMEASPELMQYLANVRTSTPDAASFDSMNVDLMPTRETPEDLYARFAGVEMPPPISRDPWFDQIPWDGPDPTQGAMPSMPREVPDPNNIQFSVQQDEAGNFFVADQTGTRQSDRLFANQADAELALQNIQQGRPENQDGTLQDMRTFMMEMMGGPQPGIQSSGGNWYIKIRDARGKVARADGPFTSEIEAHRAMRNYRSETGRQGSNFFIEQD